MAKKTTTKPEDLTPIVCQLKHEAIDKEFSNIKIDADRRHEEIKSMIKALHKELKKDVKTSHANLKDKIILTDKTVGDKIDSLSEFDDTLKGNGTPGVWENIRSINRMVKILISIVTIIIILELGGSVNRIDWDVIRDKFKRPPAAQVEPVKEPDKKLGAMEEGKSFYVPPAKKDGTE